jgi:hypothetical protein
VLDLLEYFRPVPSGTPGADPQRPARPSAVTGNPAPVPTRNPAEQSGPNKG